MVETMTIYLALDPGLTTGVAWYDIRSGEFASLEVHGRHELYRYLRSDWGFPSVDGVAACGSPIVIIERWDVRKNTHQLTNQDDVRYIIGAVEYVCHMTGLDYREQRPAEAKKFATDDKLRALGWYSGGEGHADDAARHLLVALAKAHVPEILEVIV
jgi:hypothetical protein